ncbi:MAG: hypothetical protein GC151_15485 [Betaproteobacteria bacterium]|nr:hypothetical protein [Betaproteobacteria bacterium]
MSIAKHLSGAALAVCAAFAAGSALAQSNETDPSLDELLRVVDAAMPPVITDDNSGLVDNLLGVKLGTPISEAFPKTLPRARALIFGPRVVPTRSPDCFRSTAGPDRDECVESVGQEDGGDTFRSLTYSKNLGAGNIRFLFRPKVADIQPTDLKPVDMTNQQAYEKALAFLGDAFGLPGAEVPPPPNVDVLPVRDLMVGFDPKANMAPVAIQKVVFLRRGLQLPRPLVDPNTKTEVSYLPAPGLARVALDANGNVVNAVVTGWQDLVVDRERVNPKNAKTRNDLVKEIANELFTSQGGNVQTVRILIGLTTAFNGKQGMLLPAVQVFVDPGTRDEAPPGPTTGGVVEEFPLVAFPTADLQR